MVTVVNSCLLLKPDVLTSILDLTGNTFTLGSSMAGSTFDVSFSGQLVSGAELAQVKDNVAKLFKTEVQGIEVMFSGKRVVIKRNLDQQTAMKYQAAMKNAGAMCELTENKPVVSSEYSEDNPPPIPQPDPETVAISSATQEPTSNAKPVESTVSVGDMGSVTIAPAGETIMEHEQVAEPQIDISAISIDDSRQNLVEHTPVPEPDIDISSMSIDSSGDDLVQNERIAEPEIDISSLNIDESGENLIGHKEVPPMEVDTSSMSMAPPGSAVLEEESKT